MFNSLGQRTSELLPVMIYHQVFDIVNETPNQDTEVEKLVTVSAHIECARFAPFRDPRNV